MRTSIGCAEILLGMMGIVTEAAASVEKAGLAEKRGLLIVPSAKKEKY